MIIGKIQQHNILLLYNLYTVGKPTAPLNLSVVATTLHTVVVTWTSPVTGSQCIDHYIVTVFNETHNTMTSVNTTNNITSLTIYGLVKEITTHLLLKVLIMLVRLGIVVS